MQNELKRLENLENVDLDFEVKLTDGARASVIFCEGWPHAKQVLEAIKEMSRSPFVKIAISTIVAVGEGIYNSRCAA